MKRDPKDIVREGYDKIAEKYEEWSRPSSELDNEAELDEFISHIKPDGHVLDAGCGSGIVTRYLVDNGFQVTGIDLSDRMLDLAKSRVPEATIQVGDMTALEFEDGSFDGIVSTYAVFHVPRSEHSKLFLDFHRLLRKGGMFLFSVGVCPEGTDGVWDWDVGDGVPMFWSYHGPEKTVELLKSADYEILFTRSVEIQTETELETHFWILARAN
ncbi:MAG: class I SAM-dependent methyltransferase [Candidatus Thorarchaeota archaeon]